ncbi:MAG TPA: hypothetical protein VJ276_08445 [Thermoanaerobaculia bacterium]|nr:hypothetical protein [Thermoanaerobaculia bacterium]
MVDNLNPTSQFHPYSAPDATPVSEKPQTSGLGGMLGRLGIDTGSLGSLGNMNMGKARDVARKNPGMVLGGLAALAIGAGLMRKRRVV